ncbi:MAG: hypothetical protein P8Y68_18415 [Anaerolineales bacterium]
MKVPFRHYWQLLARHIRPQMSRFILLGVLLFGGIGMRVINPQIVRFFIDTASSGGEQGLDGNQRSARRTGLTLPQSGHEFPQQRQPGRAD